MLLNDIYKVNSARWGKTNTITLILLSHVLTSTVVFLFFIRYFVLKWILSLLDPNAYPPKIRDYVSFDRINLDQFGWIDRMNCHLCTIANCVPQLYSAMLTSLSNVSAQPTVTRLFLAKCVMKVDSFIYLFTLLNIPLIYILTLSCDYRLSFLSDVLKNIRGYGDSLKKIDKKLYAVVLKRHIQAECLRLWVAQIESDWCPLHYAKKILLPHQETFLKDKESVMTLLNSKLNKEM